MSGAMRRILAFMLMLILLLARNAHAEEWESLVQELAREIAEEKNNADYGAADFWGKKSYCHWFVPFLECRTEKLVRRSIAVPPKIFGTHVMF